MSDDFIITDPPPRDDYPDYDSWALCNHVPGEDLDTICGLEAKYWVRLIDWLPRMPVCPGHVGLYFDFGWENTFDVVSDHIMGRMIDDESN